jgi:CheY-like chemotaxis protein
MDKHRSLLQELAHGLRDTLSPIRSAIDLMRLRGFDPELSRSMAERIERGLDGAIATIDAFVTADQYENGTVSVSVAPVALEHVLQRAQAALGPALKERCRFAPVHSAAPVMADAARSVQVLGAMLEQAMVAAAPATPIEIRSDAQAQRGVLQVSFAIDPRATVGEGWFDNYRSRGSGTRMALRTARRIMQLQHGELSVERPAADRCELKALFPRATGEAQAPSADPVAASPGSSVGAAQPDAARHTHIVIVDDSAEVRRAYREGLTALGYQVTEIPDAEEALRAISSAAPVVALIDIHLPGMNGFQLARALKRRAGASLRLVMLSGMTLDETMRRESKNAGFDQCFDKAAGPKALHALLLGLP